MEFVEKPRHPKKVQAIQIPGNVSSIRFSGELDHGEKFVIDARGSDYIVLANENLTLMSEEEFEEYYQPAASAPVNRTVVSMGNRDVPEGKVQQIQQAVVRGNNLSNGATLTPGEGAAPFTLGRVQYVPQ